MSPCNCRTNNYFKKNFTLFIQSGAYNSIYKTHSCAGTTHYCTTKIPSAYDFIVQSLSVVVQNSISKAVYNTKKVTEMLTAI